jgi:hypothetical protein
LIRAVELDHIAKILIGVLGIVLEDQLNPLVIFIGECPFPDVEDAKGVTFPFIWLPIFFLVSFQECLEEFFAGIFIFEFDLDDFSRRITDSVRNDSFIKTMPVVNNHLFKKVRILDVGIIRDIASKNKASHLDGDFSCRDGVGKKDKKGKEGDSVRKWNVH